MHFIRPDRLAALAMLARALVSHRSVTAFLMGVCCPWEAEFTVAFTTPPDPIWQPVVS